MTPPPVARYRSTCFANETKKAVCGREGCGAGRCAVYSGGGAAGVAAAPAGGPQRTPNSSQVPAGLPAPPFMIPVVSFMNWVSPTQE